MNYYIYGYTSKGNIREENEDRILVDGRIRFEGSRYSTVSAPFIAAVCDGVGGEKAGELAAQTCLEELAKVRYRSDVDMKSAVMDIHRKVKKHGVIGQGTLNMQTTLCALAVDEAGEALCVNVGDSRMYRYVNAAIRQISTDQSYRQFIYEHGSEGEVARIDPKLQNAIVSSVGSLTNEPEIEIIPLVTRFGKEPDDMILIVSDGISDFVSEQQLEIGMGLDLPIGQKLEAIAQLAVDNGSTDNISIVGIKPYITKQELDALTSEQKGETVNIQKLIAETDELGDILTFDLNEILSKPLEELIDHQPQPMPKPKSKAEPKKEPTPQPEPANEPETAKPADEPMPTAEPKTEEMEQEPKTAEIIEEPKPAEKTEKPKQVEYTQQQEQKNETESEAPTEEEKMTEENTVQTPAPKADQPQQEREIPDELVETKAVSEEFKVDFSRFKDKIEAQADGTAESSGEIQTGEKKKVDFSLHTVELSHQSASSLAMLEKLFGKK